MSVPMSSSPGLRVPRACKAPLGTSPPPMLGSSPPSHSMHASRSSAGDQAGAKKFWKRIRFDPALDPSGFSVGYVESVTQQVRQSGAGAWSLRVHDQVHDIPFLAFLTKFPDESDIPFHRIVFFKHRQALVWESEHYKRRQSEGEQQQAPLTPLSGGGAISVAAGRPPRSGGGGGSSASAPGPGAALAYNLRGGSPPRGASPPRPRHTSELLFPEASGTSGDLLGGSSDEDEGDGDGDEGPSYGGWDPDDMVAGQMDGDGLPAQGAGEEEDDEEEGGLSELELPEECWRAVLHALSVRDVCMTARVNRWLHQLASCPALWREQYARIFGSDPLPTYNAATVRRMCRRSEIRAARWLEADVQEQAVGYPDTSCLQLDDSKVVSGDGQAVRVWSHATGRRIATLKGHTAAVTSVAYDDSLLVSGCAQGTVRIWGMDDLKCTRTFRTAHDGVGGGVAGVALLNGIPVTAGADGCVKLWDVSSGQPIMALDHPRPAPGAVAALEVAQSCGYILAAGDGVCMWDAGTVQLLHDLRMDVGGPPLPLSPTAAAPAGPLDDGAGNGGLGDGRFQCVAYSGNVLAAGLGGRVVLWDPRCAAAVGAVHAPIELGVGAQCAAVQLDEWKLLAAFNRGTEGMAALYDMRAVPAAAARQQQAAVAGAAARQQVGRRWLQPLLVLPAPGRITCMRFHGELLMAGIAGGHDACLWSFQPPGLHSGPAAGALRSSGTGEHYNGGGGPSAQQPFGSAGGMGGSWGAGGGGEALGRSPPGALGEQQGGTPPGGGGEDRGRRRGKPAKQVKKQNRYPKRK